MAKLYLIKPQGAWVHVDKEMLPILARYRWSDARLDGDITSPVGVKSKITLGRLITGAKGKAKIVKHLGAKNDFRRESLEIVDLVPGPGIKNVHRDGRGGFRYAFQFATQRFDKKGFKTPETAAAAMQVKREELKRKFPHWPPSRKGLKNPMLR